MNIESKSRSATGGDQDERPDIYMSGLKVAKRRMPRLKVAMEKMPTI